MAAAIGWYGPLIDLSKASSYIGDYVQLLVYVHRSTPVQYKISRNGGDVVRMDILVGDETRSYFPVTIWQKQMGSQVSAGHVYLLQNLKIAKFGDVVEARAIYCSSLQCLLRPDDFVAPNGLDKVIGECRVGITARDKLQKVVGWLQRARLVHCGGALNYYEFFSVIAILTTRQQCRCQDCLRLPSRNRDSNLNIKIANPIIGLENIFGQDKGLKIAGTVFIFLEHAFDAMYDSKHRRQIKVNWKVHEEMRSQDISSLTELYECENNWKANFHASVGEIFLPITWVDLDENEAERMFISRRLHTPSEKSIVDDLITTTGCQMCGTPVNARTAYGRELFEKKILSYKIANLLPDLFLSYPQEGVLQGSSVEQNTSLYCQNSSSRFHVVGTIYRPLLLYVWDDMKYLPISVGNKAAEILFGNISAEKVYSSYKDQWRRKDGTNPHQSSTDKIHDKKHGKNSSLRFKVTVNKDRDWENGRLEMVSVSFPAFGRTI
ncbi:hypothetical protein OROHE_018597 [Orobanche hederae]